MSEPSGGPPGFKRLNFFKGLVPYYTDWIDHESYRRDKHRWHWFSGLDREQVIVFKTNDSDHARPRCVPHVAFDNPDCPADVPPRASIEMRAIAYWFDDAHA